MKNRKGTLKYAFIKSTPVMIGYIFLGAAAGIMMVQAGYNPVWTFFSSLFVYAGSGQFLLASLLESGSSLAVVFFMSFAINSRHIFYGLSMISRFRGTGAKKPYLIFATTDETFSVLCSTEYPPYVDEKECMFYISLFDHLYWIFGTVFGSLIRELIPFDFKGVEFAMTALFVVIVVDQWQKSSHHESALIGIGCGIVCLALIGADNFILPCLALVAGLLIILRKPLEKRYADGEAAVEAASDGTSPAVADENETKGGDAK